MKKRKTRERALEIHEEGKLVQVFNGSGGGPGKTTMLRVAAGEEAGGSWKSAAVVDCSEKAVVF